MNLQSNLRKAPKMSARVLHPGSNKQSVPLALAIFHETTSAAITSYFPNCKDASDFLKVFNTWWIITNSKSKFNTNNRIGNAAILGDNKPDFLKSLADWLEKWKDEALPNCERFTLTGRTCSVLKRTLRCTASLIEDLLSEGYTYVLTSRFQSDPLERRFSQYRQMSGGRFLVGLREVNSSEKILKIKSLLKEEINFWEEDLHLEKNESSNVERLTAVIKERSIDMDSVKLAPESREVAIYIAGLVVKKFIENFKKCGNCDMVGTINEDADDHAYLVTLNRGVLIVRRIVLFKNVFRFF